MVLASAQIDSFIRDGYLHLEAVVPKSKLKESNRLINHSLGKPGELTPGGIQDGMGKLGGGISNCKTIRSLYFGGVKRIAEDFLGANNCEDANLSAQIALRFPQFLDEDVKSDNASTSSNPPMWHTDGLRQGKLHPFSLLIGICLSDVNEDNAGNLLCYPGTHHLISQCIVGPYGQIDTSRLQRMIDGDHIPSSPEDIHAAEAASENIHDNEPTLPIPGPLHSFKMKSGDVVFLHPDLPHCGDVNFSCDTRVMVYFRLRRKVEKGSSWDAMSIEHRKWIYSDYLGSIQMQAREVLSSSTIFHSGATSDLQALRTPLHLPPVLREDKIELKDKQMMSRLLYSNPVCLLSTRLRPSPTAQPSDNIMVVSWLTCIDNRANVFLSINEKRHSARIFCQPADIWKPVSFVLSVPTASMKDAILNVGSCHGDQVEKFDTIAGITKCGVGWSSIGSCDEEMSTSVPAIQQCVGHLKLEVPKRPDNVGGHWRVFAAITSAFVKTAYWDGKIFGPRHFDDPPLLSFHGTKCFSTQNPAADQR